MNGNLSVLDLMTIISLVLQVAGYQNDIAQSSNDDLMRELQKQDREIFQVIIENQKSIISTQQEILNLVKEIKEK